MQIIVFTKNNSAESVNVPERPGFLYKNIKFDTNDLDELLLIAKFRIINFPTSLIIDSRNRVLLKIRGSIPDSYIQKYVS